MLVHVGDICYNEYIWVVNGDECVWISYIWFWFAFGLQRKLWNEKPCLNIYHDTPRLQKIYESKLYCIYADL